MSSNVFPEPQNHSNLDFCFVRIGKEGQHKIKIDQSAFRKFDSLPITAQYQKTNFSNLCLGTSVNLDRVLDRIFMEYLGFERLNLNLTQKGDY